MKTKIIAVGALLLAAGAAQAQEFKGEVSLSYGNAPFLSSDDDDERLS